MQYQQAHTLTPYRQHVSGLVSRRQAYRMVIPCLFKAIRRKQNLFDPGIIGRSYLLLDPTDVCWLLRTSVRKKEGVALVFFIFLAALVLY